MLGIIVTIFAIGIVIFIHELGHMLCAKRAGIGVFEFSIGMGPQLIAVTRHETKYTLRLLPFGGFVKLAGIDDHPDENSSPEINFFNKPFLSRFLTIAAGSLTNIIFGFLIFCFIFSMLGIPTLSTVIDRLTPDSPAAKAGLKSHDEIVAINNIPIKNIEKDLLKVIQNSTGTPLTIKYIRQNQPFSAIIIPESTSKAGQSVGRIGVYFGIEVKRSSPIDSVQLAIKETYNNIRLVFVSISMLIHHEAGMKDLAGPIGIIQVASFQWQKGLIYFLNIIAMISISLGVINLFPIPVLDGGHLFFLILEGIFRRPLNRNIMGYINQAGVIVLIFLMALIVVNDIINWGERIAMLKKL